MGSGFGEFRKIPHSFLRGASLLSTRPGEEGGGRAYARYVYELSRVSVGEETLYRHFVSADVCVG